MRVERKPSDDMSRRNRNRNRSNNAPANNQQAAPAASDKLGLSAAFRVLAHENQAEFDELLDQRLDEHKPKGPHQVFLVSQMAIAEWQLARYQRFEARLIDHIAGAPALPNDPDSAIVAKLFDLNPKSALQSIQRSIDRAEKAYHRAMRELKADFVLMAQADRLERQQRLAVQPTQRPAPLSDLGEQWDEMNRKWLDDLDARFGAASA